MINYKELVDKTLNGGQHKPAKGVMTRELFGKQLTFHLGLGFPIVTGRKIFHKGVLGELAAFLAGPTHVNDFKDRNCNYWDIFADDDGSLRLAYGNAWRDFHGVDQLAKTAQNLRDRPNSRRHLISAWDPTGLEQLSLQCCHYAYQWSANADGTLDMVWVQRSADLMLGIPSDIILAAVLNMLMAQTVGRFAGKIILQLGSVHIYEPHYAAAEEYLKRDTHFLPSWTLAPEATVFNFTPDMLELRGYKHEGVINFELLK